MPSLIPDLAPAAARTATGQGSGVFLGTAESVSILVDVTAVSGTSPSNTFSVEWSNDNTAWAQGDPADTFTAITAASKKVKQFAAKGRWVRLVWTITGTTPSFTFSASATTISQPAV